MTSGKVIKIEMWGYLIYKKIKKHNRGFYIRINSKAIIKLLVNKNKIKNDNSIIRSLIVKYKN